MVVVNFTEIHGTVSAGAHQGWRRPECLPDAFANGWLSLGILTRFYKRSFHRRQ